MHRAHRLVRTAALALLAGLILSSVAPGPVAQAQTRLPATVFINGGGSSFIDLLMSRWAFVYGATVEHGVRINYQPVGNGPGIIAFSKRAVDFAGVDSFLTTAQVLAAGGDVLYLPLALYPLAITYNLPGLSAPLRLDGQTLAQIFQGKITVWDDPAIAGLNPGLALPKTPITVVHRTDLSGTTFTLTNYLSAVSSDWKAHVGAAPNVSWPVGTGVRSSASLAATVGHVPGAISYVEFSYAVADNLPMAAIHNRSGAFVLPTVAGATGDAANAGPLPADLRAVISDAPGADSYPISGFSWVLVHRHAPIPYTYAPLLRFLWWCAHAGQQYTQSGALRFAPLPPGLVTSIENTIRSVTYHGTPLYTG